MAAAPPRPPLDFAKEELFDLMQRFLEYLAEMSERMPFVVNRQKIRSIATLAALSVAIYITWKILRASPTQQRRQNRRLSQVTTVSGARISSNSVVSQSPYHSSPAHLRPQGTVDKLFQSGKLTLEKIVRHRLNEGRKVTCQLLGVILEETTPEDLQEHATFRSSVRDVLVEIAKFCDVYLMERILDDASAERVLLALKDAGLFTAGVLNIDKVLFCGTENGRMSFVRQLEPDWHIDTNPEIVHQLSRFIKYQLHISSTRTERAALNVFSAPCLEQFFGV
ncbi:hypothetical protein HPP92_004139 [Vanilla planifolia]|uniref:Peroxisome biogenesis protein 22 n=1 Tax=Vanilla planifolia TaxID=51239 RepID=A0A835VJM0_VANPL|nr:hypothetical protein HPP92_004139 [Vanilla planifolia]